MTLRETLRKGITGLALLALLTSVGSLDTLDGGYKRGRRQDITYTA
jgi:hypothetical protein